MQCFGVGEFFFFGNFLGNPFVIFAEEQGEKKGGRDAETGGVPSVDLRKGFFEPVRLAVAVWGVDPGADLGEEVFKNIQFATEFEDAFRFSATQEFLNFFVEAGGGASL